MESNDQLLRRRADISRLLRPRSVAIVGASATPGALGASLLGNLERNGFGGQIHLINPKRSEIHGRPCLSSVLELPESVDVAVLAIPQPMVLETVRMLAVRRVGAVVIFSAGFAEAGERGLADQNEIAVIARREGMVVEGPNCLGCINYLDRVPLTFVEVDMGVRQDRTDERPLIGIVSQSGAMMAVLCTTLSSRHLPLSFAVSTGNEAASHAEDYVEFLLEEPRTRVIAMIVEQFRHPGRMLAAVRQARILGKLVVVLHPGKSGAARASAATHTGALAGDYALMRTKLERAGVVFAETLEELGDIVEIAARCPALPEPGVAVVGESGAFKALSLDLAEELGMTLPAFDEHEAPALRAAMPAFVPVSNPLDLTAQGLVEPELYYRVLRALFEDARCSTVIVGLIQGDPVTSGIKMPPVLRAVRELAPSKAVIVAGLDEGAEVPAAFIAEMQELGIPYFPSTERAFRAVQRLCRQTERQASAQSLKPIRLELPLGVDVVPEYQAKMVLAGAGIPFPEGRLVRTLTEAVSVSEHMGYPVVLKAQSARLSHKSDAGGVALDICDAQTLHVAWKVMHERLREHDPDLELDGVLVERMGDPGLEMIIGARVDPQWGPVILVGMGGVTAEVIRDSCLIDVDLTVDEILQAMQKLRSIALFRGFRGEPERDLGAVAELVARLGQVLRGSPGILEIDLNPVVVYPTGRGVVALDALMVCENGSQGSGVAEEQS